MYLTIQGIVLRVTDYNDKDALLTMLTRRHGRLTVKARGLRRKNSPLIAPCQLLAYGEFTLFEYRGQYTINEAQSIELFTPLRRDLTKLSLGTYFAQVSEVLSQEDMPNPELQSLLLNCLYALRNGLAADFSPKPLRSEPGNGMHINLSARSSTGEDIMPQVIAGILSHIADMTAFLNTTPASYQRFGSYKAPRYISWSSENRSQLIRIPAAEGEYRRAELRSPDPICNPYIAYTLLIYAGLDGIRRRAELPASADINFYTASEEVRSQYKTLPATLADAKAAAKSSEFIASSLPRTVVEYYTK